MNKCKEYLVNYRFNFDITIRSLGGKATIAPTVHVSNLLSNDSPLLAFGDLCTTLFTVNTRVFVGVWHYRSVGRQTVHSHWRRLQSARIRRALDVLLLQMRCILSWRLSDQSLAAFRETRHGHGRKLQHHRRKRFSMWYVIRQLSDTGLWWGKTIEMGFFFWKFFENDREISKWKSLLMKTFLMK